MPGWGDKKPLLNPNQGMWIPQPPNWKVEQYSIDPLTGEKVVPFEVQVDPQAIAMYTVLPDNICIVESDKKSDQAIGKGFEYDKNWGTMIFHNKHEVPLTVVVFK